MIITNFNETMLGPFVDAIETQCSILQRLLHDACDLRHANLCLIMAIMWSPVYNNDRLRIW